MVDDFPLTLINAGVTDALVRCAEGAMSVEDLADDLRTRHAEVVSGAMLMLYYHPTEASAYESVRKIMHEVPYGWLVRSVVCWVRVVSCRHRVPGRSRRMWRGPCRSIERVKLSF